MPPALATAGPAADPRSRRRTGRAAGTRALRPPGIDLADPALPAAIHGAFDVLRVADPVHRLRDDTWLLTRYDDVAAALRDRERCGTAVRRDVEDALARLEDGLLVPLGAADVGRGAFASPVTRAHVEAATEAVVAPVADDVLDALPDRDEVDWVTAVAQPLPTRVFAALFGLPGSDVDMLLRLTHAATVALDAQLAPDLVAPEDVVHGRRAMLELRDYVESLAAHRHHHRSGDLLSVLLDGHDAGRLTWDDVLAQATEALAAGTRTTTTLVAGMLDAFGAHPAEWSRVRDEPGLVVPAVEEALRHVSPALTARRVALCDFGLRGRRIRAGDVLQCAVLAANRDPAVFARPHAFHAGRTPNPHLAFAGARSCLGAHVARVVARVVLGRAARRWRRIEVDRDAVALAPTLLARTYATLPVRLG